MIFFQSLSSIAPVLVAGFLAVRPAVAAQVPRASCTVWVPGFRDEPIFNAGETTTITWDVNEVAANPCIIPSFELDSSPNEVLISTLATNINPLSGSLTFTFPSVPAGPYYLAFNAADGRYDTPITVY